MNNISLEMYSEKPISNKSILNERSQNKYMLSVHMGTWQLREISTSVDGGPRSRAHAQCPDGLGGTVGAWSISTTRVEGWFRTVIFQVWK